MVEEEKEDPKLHRESVRLEEGGKTPSLRRAVDEARIRETTEGMQKDVKRNPRRHAHENLRGGRGRRREKHEGSKMFPIRRIGHFSKKRIKRRNRWTDKPGNAEHLTRGRSEQIHARESVGGAAHAKKDEGELGRKGAIKTRQRGKHT